MRILYFHQHFSTPKGSVGTRPYEMAKRAVDAGHEVTVVCGTYGIGHSGLSGPFIKGQRTGQVDGIEIIEFQLNYSNDDSLARRTMTFFRYAGGAVKIALTRKADLTFASTTPLTAGIPGVVAKWLLHRPFVFEVRDLWPELPRAMGVITNPLILSALSVLEFVTYRSADRLIALAPGIAAGIERRGVDRDRIAIIPNGCDLDLFSPSTRPVRPAGIAPDALLATFAGAHGQANGLADVLAAARELMRRGRNDIVILMVGAGKLKPALVDQAAREQLHNVVFMPPVPKLELADTIAASDVGIQSLANVEAFYYGTSPNKFFDYISAGKPVIINYPGWVAELVTREKCGFVVTPQDPVAFADALEQAAASRAELLTMGAAARSLAEREFSRSDLSRRWVEWVTGQPVK